MIYFSRLNSDQYQLFLGIILREKEYNFELNLPEVPQANKTGPKTGPPGGFHKTVAFPNSIHYNILKVGNNMKSTPTRISSVSRYSANGKGDYPYNHSGAVESRDTYGRKYPGYIYCDENTRVSR